MFIVPHRLPGLNEFIGAINRNRYTGNTLKTEADNIVYLYARNHPKVGRCIVHIEWTEPNKRRDVDNVYSGAKFVLDGIRKAGIIKDDSPKYVADIKNTIVYGDKAQVKVDFEEVE